MALCHCLPSFASFQSIAQTDVPAISQEQSRDTEETGSQWIQLGEQQYQSGQIDTAIASWKKALVQAKQTQNIHHEGASLVRLGQAYLAKEDYRNATQTLETFQNLPDHELLKPMQAQALSNLGIAYTILGRYNLALITHRQAGRLLYQRNDRLGLAKSLSNLGNTFEAIGHYEDAIIAYRQSLRLTKEQGDLRGEAITTSNLGHIYANQGQYKQAITFFQASLKLAQELRQPAQAASAWISLGATYFAQGKLNQSIRAYREGLSQAKISGNRSRMGQALGGIGISHTALKGFTTAIYYHQQSLEIFRELGDRRAQSLALSHLGDAHHKAGNLIEAESHLWQAIQGLETLRTTLQDLDSVSIFDTQASVYLSLQEVLIAQGKQEKALEVSEWSRARAFSSLLSQRIHTTSSVNQVADQYRRQKLQPRSSQPPPIKQLRQIAQRRQATLVEYTLIPETDFVARGKQRGAAETLYIWVVQPDGTVHHRSVDLRPWLQSEKPMTKLVRSARCFGLQLLCERRVGNSQFDLTALRGRTTPASVLANVPPEFISSELEQRPLTEGRGLEQLHRILIHPIADLLPQKPEQPIIFIPHGELFLVPFPALKDAEGQSLIERHTITTAPSIQVLELTQQTQQRNRARKQPIKTLIVGNPTMPSVQLAPGSRPIPLVQLPGAEAEAFAIAKTLNTEALTGDQATENQVLKQLTEAKWIHLATHGLLSYGSESRNRTIPGALALAPDSDSDGLLTSNEIMGLRLHADMVVLSACDTGRGTLTGDGVIGLSRAWMASGVPSVVVSLWAVSDDSTALLMKAFYQNLNRDLDKAQALRQAMLTTAQTYPNPRDWAAFTLMGEP